MRISSLEALFPPFAEQLIELEKLLAAYRFHRFETYRSFQRQLELYAQGREQKNEIWAVTDPQKIVTKAKPGRSFHAYGLAADYVPDGNDQKTGVQWDWEDYDQARPGRQPIPWEVLGRASAEVGIEWAGTWVTFQEFPHVQNRFGLQISDLYPILTNEGLESVWKFLMRSVRPNASTVVVPVDIATIDKSETRDVSPIVMTEDDLNYIADTNAQESPTAPPDSPRPTIWELFVTLIRRIFQF